MSTLYKRQNSPYYWWGARYKGRKLAKSTTMTQKHLAKKVKDHWDLNLILGDLSFLGLIHISPMAVTEYVNQYLHFIQKRKSDKTYRTACGILDKFRLYLESMEVNQMDEITVSIIDGYLDTLKVAPKTKKNHLIEISLLLKQAVKEELILSNPAKRATLPKIVKEVNYAKK